MAKENDKKIIVQVVPAIKMPRMAMHTFSYVVGKQFEKKIKVGMFVEIPFRNKNVIGIIYEIQKNTTTKKKRYKLKNITNLLDENINITKKQIQLAKYISNYYLSSLNLVTKITIPTITKNKARKEISLNYNCKIPVIKKNTINALLNKIQKKEKILLIHNLQAEKHNLYFNIIKKTLKNNEQVLILVPEYFDVYNFANYYINKFTKNKTAIITSELTKNQYFDEWKKINNTQAQIIIGTRQAVFAPFQNLKLIICDDEHNSSYKQWDQNPRYHGIKIAKKLSELWKAKIILSSPTPSIETYYLSEKNKVYSKMEFIQNQKKNSFEFVNMENERKEENYSVLSERLKNDLREKIYQKKQVIVFIPRLGENTVTKCNDCGFIAECEECKNVLISSQNYLYCMHCRKKTNLIKKCPKCQGQNIKSFGYGSENVEKEIRKIFENKNIKIQRIDSVTISRGKNQMKIYKDFINQKIDILIGTKMVLKNWNMKNLSILAIIFPEIIFNQVEFKTTERAVQFLKFIYNQTNKNQKIILQTADIENKMFSYLKNNLDDFYKKEIENRKLPSGIGYPPFSQLIKLVYKNHNRFLCQKEAKNTYLALKEKLINNKKFEEHFEITKPFPASNFQEYGKYHWHIIIKSNFPNIKLRNSLLDIIKQDWIIDIDPDSIL